MVNNFILLGFHVKLHVGVKRKADHFQVQERYFLLSCHSIACGHFFGEFIRTTYQMFIGSLIGGANNILYSGLCCWATLPIYRIYCIVPKNIHTPPPQKVFWFNSPWKFKVSFTLSYRNFGFETPHSLRIWPFMGWVRIMCVTTHLFRQTWTILSGNCLSCNLHQLSGIFVDIIFKNVSRKSPIVFHYCDEKS